MRNRIGVIYQMHHLLEEGPEKLFNLGVECIQLQSFEPEKFTKENAEKVLELLDGKVEISSFWCGWSGPQIWGLHNGPSTLGIVPEAYRSMRVKELCKGADFAKMLGVTEMATHLGFVPEYPMTDAYRGVFCAVKTIADYCESLGIHFNFETGQETPPTLMRLVQDLDTEYVGINLDPANLITYGKGNPIDALDIFGDRIRGVHVKDGVYASGDFHKHGQQTFIGEGAVNFPVFLPKLIKQGYKGDLYIEREITGEQQMIDIKKTIVYVNEILDTIFD